MCLSIILLLFSNIDFFVRPFVVEISLSFVGTGAKLRQLDQFWRQLSPPVDSSKLEPTGNTGAETGAEAGARAGENWRKKTGAYWRRSSSTNHPPEFQEILT